MPPWPPCCICACCAAPTPTAAAAVAAMTGVASRSAAPRQAVVDQQVLARHLDLEIDHRGAARRYRDGLHVGKRLGAQRGEIVDLVEYLADHVEGRGVVRPADTEIDAHRLAPLGRQRVLRRE